MEYEEAFDKLTKGEISGMVIGERVYAKKDTVLTSDEKPTTAWWISRGLHLVAITFSRSELGFEINGKKWTGRKKDFGFFDDGKIVLKTW